jgi:hypothetical protein
MARFGGGVDDVGHDVEGDHAVELAERGDARRSRRLLDGPGRGAGGAVGKRLARHGQDPRAAGIPHLHARLRGRGRPRGEPLARGGERRFVGRVLQQQANGFVASHPLRLGVSLQDRLPHHVGELRRRGLGACLAGVDQRVLEQPERDPP